MHQPLLPNNQTNQEHHADAGYNQSQSIIVETVPPMAVPINDFSTATAECDRYKRQTILGFSLRIMGFVLGWMVVMYLFPYALKDATEDETGEETAFRILYFYILSMGLMMLAFACLFSGIFIAWRQQRIIRDHGKDRDHRLGGYLTLAEGVTYVGLAVVAIISGNDVTFAASLAAAAVALMFAASQLRHQQQQAAATAAA